jgi:hypothetical protein
VGGKTFLQFHNDDDDDDDNISALLLFALHNGNQIHQTQSFFIQLPTQAVM